MSETSSSSTSTSSSTSDNAQNVLVDPTSNNTNITNNTNLPNDTNNTKPENEENNENSNNTKPAEPTTNREEKVLQEIEEWMATLQKIDKRKDKLSRITGRRNSLDKLSPFLVAQTEEEALEKGNLILQSDRLKQKTGERPDYKELQQKEKKTKKAGGRKGNKIGGLFGRRHSFDEISELLNVESGEDAMENAMKLRRMEKLKKMAGI